jgi:TRAP-type mannitol/chloroaromatic compound transport system permease large subunit
VAEGRRAQRTAGSRAGSDPRLQLAAYAVGVVLSAVAWIFLVHASIDFGVAAAHGRSAAWLFTAGAGLGAVGCLVLVLALVGRALRTLGFMPDYKPRRAAARRRK